MATHMTNFRAEDMPHGGKPQPNAEPRTEKLTEVEYEGHDGSVTPEEQADKGANLSLPSGSAADVLKWVDGDPARARLALDTEAGQPTPRKGLTADLKEIVDK